jgi:hypothetical protein
MMIHQHGACIGDGVDLHLGQKPKLGGRYADGSLIYISYFVCPMYIHVSLSFLCCSCSYFYFPKHKKTKKYFRCFSLFDFSIASFSLLYLLFSVWYLKNPKIFCFVCYFLLFLFQKSKTQKYLLFFGFVKFVAEFSFL